MRRIEVTLTDEGDQDEPWISAAFEIDQDGESGDMFAGSSGSTPAEALRALADDVEAAE